MKKRVLFVFKHPYHWNPDVINKFSNYYEVDSLHISDFKEESFNQIISKINTFFGEDICGGIKIIQFEDEDLSFKKNMIKDNSNKFFSKIKKIKNEKIRKSLLKLSKNIKIK